MRRVTGLFVKELEKGRERERYFQKSEDEGGKKKWQNVDTLISRTMCTVCTCIVRYSHVPMLYYSWPLICVWTTTI